MYSTRSQYILLYSICIVKNWARETATKTSKSYSRCRSSHPIYFQTGIGVLVSVVHGQLELFCSLYINIKLTLGHILGNNSYLYNTYNIHSIHNIYNICNIYNIYTTHNYNTCNTCNIHTTYVACQTVKTYIRCMPTRINCSMAAFVLFVTGPEVAKSRRDWSRSG